MNDRAGPGRSGHSTPANVLVINGGSSSIKCAVFAPGDPPTPVLREAVARDAESSLLEWLERQPALATVGAAGHRLVCGMQHCEPELVTEALMHELRAMSAFVPEHLPAELTLIDAIRGRFPRLPQVACFDTAFHRDLPPVARTIAIPRRYQARGIRRYGFHGISYAYLMGELARTAGAGAARGRVILAHLGSGASLAAVQDGKSVDTSMGFSPASGLVMGTRAGDIDPGLYPFLARSEGMTAGEFERMVNHESGLVGVSETSSDMRDLLSREPSDPRAAEAVDLFCYQARKWAGAFAAVLGGLDTLVFAGGIGENAPRVRSRICEGLEFLGLELDGVANDRNAGLISGGASRVAVRVIRTNEELMIARDVFRVLGQEVRP